MAALFETLAITGSRKSDGTANASGRAWFYQPGSTSAKATIYGDAAESAPISNPVTLDAAGRATVYFTGQVDVFLETANRLPIGTFTLSDRAERVEVKNAGFTGTLPSGSTGAGGATTLNTVLSRIFASVGGLDGQYKEYTGATGRAIADKFREQGVSVKDYGAVGNGIADDTTAIQAALNEVARLGGGTVYFPPGTYNTSAKLTCTTSGVSISGGGKGKTIIRVTSTVIDALAFTGCDSFFVERIAITNQSGSATGNVGLAFSNCTNVRVSAVKVSNYNTAVSVTGAGTSSNFLFDSNCDLAGSNVDAASRGLLIKPTTGLNFVVVGCIIDAGSNGIGVEFDLGASQTMLVGNVLAGSSTTNVKYTSTLTGINHRLVGNTIGSAISLPGTAPRGYYQNGNGINGVAQTVASGGTVAPLLSSGPDVLIIGTSTGVAFTVSPPTPTPDANDRNVWMFLSLRNSAGGAITGWTMNAVYHLQTAPSTVNGETTHYLLLWDPATSTWRQISRSVTT